MINASTATAEQRIAIRVIAKDRANLIDQFATWEQECAEDRANGHRPHYCVHGTDCWTDWDNICGPCEDGFTSVAAIMPVIYANALSRTRSYMAAMHAAMDASKAADVHGFPFDLGAAFDAINARYRF